MWTDDNHVGRLYKLHIVAKLMVVGNQILWLVVCVALTLTEVDGWANEYQGPFDYSCEHQQPIIAIFCYYNVAFNDRIFDFACAFNLSTDPNIKCVSKDYVRDYYNTSKYECPDDHFISGVSSTFVNNARMFGIKCCTSSSIKVRGCYVLSFSTSSSPLMRISVPAGILLKAFDIEGDNPKSQRFRFRVCPVIK